MKCPSCNSSFSDLRDICPSCRMDLRVFKQQHGLPISYVAASYEALLKKFEKEEWYQNQQQQDPSQSEDALKTNPSFAKSVISIAPADDESETKSVPSQTKVENSSLLNEEDAPFALKDNPDDLDDAVEIALNELLQKELLRQQEKTSASQYDDIVVQAREPLVPEDAVVINEEPPVRIDTPNPELKEERSPTIETADTQIFIESSETETSNTSSDTVDLLDEIVELKESVAQSDQISINDQATCSESKDKMLQEQVLMEERFSSQPEITEIFEPGFFIYDAREESEELAALFDESYAALNEATNELEISLHQIAGLSDNERIKLLFDLSYDSFENPERDFSFLLNPEISRNSGLELLELKKTQEKLVFRAPSDPLPPLRSSQRRIASHRTRPAPLRQAQLRKKIPLKNAPIGERLVVFLLDASCMLLLGLVCALFVSIINSDNIDFFMVQLLSLHPLSIAQLIKSSILGIALMSILYPLLSLLSTGTTMGISLLGLSIEKEDSTAPTAANIIVRSCCFPLMLILIGPLPIFPGERFFHDYAGRVVVGKRI